MVVNWWGRQRSIQIHPNWDWKTNALASMRIWQCLRSTTPPWSRNKFLMDRNSESLSTLMALMQAWNWERAKSIKDFKICCVSDLYCIRNIHVHLVKSSTMVRKKRALECVGTLCGPQLSQYNKSNGAWRI